MQNILQCSGDLGERDCQDSKGGPWGEMQHSWEGELVESFCSGRTGHQQERWYYHLTFKSSEQELFKSELFLSAWTKLENKMRWWRSNNRPKLGSSSKRCPVTWHCYWCFGALADRSLEWLPSESHIKHLKESDAGTSTQSVDSIWWLLWLTWRNAERSWEGRCPRGMTSRII